MSEQTNLDEERPPAGTDLAATAGLMLYAAAIGAGFSRVFTDWSFVGDLIAIIVVGHGLSYLFRLIRLPAIYAVPLLLVAIAWTIAIVNYRSTLQFGLPLTDTWEAIRADLDNSLAEFRTATAPVPYAGGWRLLAAITFGLAVWLADTFAFRAQARGEALVPGAVVFVFIAALGVEENRVLFSLAVIGTGFYALALIRQRAERRPRTWLGSPGNPLLGAAPAALCAAAVVMAGAWALAPHLPGADADPLFDATGSGTGDTEVVSPLVDIRPRLVNDADNVQFTVVATQPSYWRLVSLPQFDGRRWDLRDGELDSTTDELGAALPGSLENRLTVTIDDLTGSFVPVAAEPVQASGPNAHFNALTSALIKTETGLRTDDTYQVVSAMPRFDPDELRQATSTDPPDPVFLQLPADLPPVVAATAAEVTAGEDSNFDRLLTLQNWFRSEFTYSTDIDAGSGNSAIEQFLADRQGYCEQFAGTFAAMARSMGLPARVAVGFTQGEPSGDGTYTVLGRNAHAWPEVWFDGFGWVPFEPTPGRGMPGAEAWTGVPPRQDGDPPPQTAPPTTTTTTTTTTTVPDGGVVPPDDSTTTTTTTTTVAPPLDDQASGDDDDNRLWLIIALIIIIVASLLAVPALVRRWRRSRHKPLTDPAHVLLDLWDRAIAALGAIGFTAPASLTPTEVSAAAAIEFPELADPLARLASAATVASYGQREAAAEIAAADRRSDGNGPHDWTDIVEVAVENSLTFGERIRRYFTVWH